MTKQYKFADGVRSAIPVSLGYISIGAAFGIVAAAQSFSVWQVLCLSIFLYAGSGQFIIVAMMAVKAPVSLIAMTIFLVNFRMFLQSLTATQIFPHQTLASGIAMGTLMTDESFGVLSMAHAQKLPITVPWMQGVNVMSYLTWIFATVAGAAVGTLIPDPEKFGLDYALVAMFIGLLVLTVDAMRKTEKLRLILAVGLVSIICYLLTAIIASSYVAVLVATVIGALVGAVLSAPQHERGT
ncbi:AzlC family ABC transporter permease [Lactococcus insecticola]|uniref:Branched-chain amino acid transporter AzlC n=1 Tax=Pseudolactococcus insecticola TaxID=2709158 RepID=A0A6A0B4K9_9LACT|nr:AzlC family ABC transporter permease [Lactococcus insecticola]GFH40122.1 branched-chain amino acid transporter AzlC [Lactococcus insecticola]